MPIFEYHCCDCSHKFESLTKGDAPMPSCPECGGLNVKRLISNFGFRGKAADGSTTTSSGSGCAGCSASTCSGCH